MADGTKISWTDATWSPVTGCTRVSEGCLNCYIERTPPFRMQGRRFSLPIVGGTTGVQLHPDRLDQPLRWRKPRRIFVCSMADLFHDDVPDGYIAQVFAAMAHSKHHVFQVLTKRPARMRSLLGASHFPELVTTWAWRMGIRPKTRLVEFPLSNVWLGVSVESQQWADIRIPLLLDTPAVVRWISAEPLLGPVDLSKWLGPVDWPSCWDEDHSPSEECSRCIQPEWVVCGGESGPGARPMHPDWARALRDQCTAAGVAYHFKQHGEWAPIDSAGHSVFDYVTDDDRCQIVDINGRLRGRPWPGWAIQDGTRDAVAMRKYGKSKSGRVLDGRTWDEYPVASA